MSIHVAVIDVGSPNRNLGWAVVGPEPEYGKCLGKCIQAVVKRLERGAVALGFEAPMFVPKRDSQDALLRARCGECSGDGNRPFSAAAGATVLVVGLAVVPFVLKGIKNKFSDVEATLDWKDFRQNKASLLLFEAFVTGSKKTGSHIGDAKLAAEKLLNDINDISKLKSAINEKDCFNLLAAAMLQCGLSTDIGLLSQECLVVKP